MPAPAATLPTCLSCDSDHKVVFGFCERCRQPPGDPEWAVARRGETADQKRRRMARQTEEQKEHTRRYQKEWRERKKAAKRAKLLGPTAAPTPDLAASDVEGMP